MLQDRQNKEAEQYFAFCLEKARAHPEAEAVLQVRAILAQWEKWAMSEKWTGRTGAFDRAVFLAHLYCANSAASLTYHASVRQTAELAQTAIVTVSRVNRRLADLGLIRPHNGKRYTEAATFTLPPDPPTGEPAQVEHSDKYGTSLFMSECSFWAGDAFSAVWEHRGLGKTARLIWESLSTTKVNYQEIKESSGRGMRTVERWVPRLSKYGLVVKTERGYQQAQKIDWAATARQLQTQNIQANRIIKHQRERERFARLMLMDE